MSDYFESCVEVLTGEMQASGGTAVPVSLPEVISRAEQTEGVRLAELLAELEPDREAVAAALAEILAVTLRNEPPASL